MTSDNKDEAPDENREARGSLIRFLEDEIWPRIPAEILDRSPMSKAEREKILGMGPQSR
jgi:hypothetical protein